MRAALFIAALAASSSANAILPDGGWYWNPNESGRGFNIEIQNDVLFMAGFVYDGSGNPVWFITAGPMTSDHTFSGDMIQASGGQCIGCAYRGQPGGAKIGTAFINFTSNLTATITLNGTVINAQREQFGLDFSNPATPLLGEWTTTMGSPILPVYFGDRIKLAATANTSSGLTAVGTRTGDPQRAAVGSYISSTGDWGILVDSSSSYYTIYSFSFTGFNSVSGVSSTFLKGSNPSGTLDFFGSRIASGAAAAGANAPGAKAARPSISSDEADRLRMEAQSTDKASMVRVNAAFQQLRNTARE